MFPTVLYILDFYLIDERFYSHMFWLNILLSNTYVRTLDLFTDRFRAIYWSFFYYKYFKIKYSVLNFACMVGWYIGYNPYQWYFILISKVAWGNDFGTIGFPTTLDIPVFITSECILTVKKFDSLNNLHLRATIRNVKILFSSLIIISTIYALFSVSIAYTLHLKQK